MAVQRLRAEMSILRVGCVGDSLAAPGRIMDGGELLAPHPRLMKQLKVG